ncbi:MULTISPECIES: DUF6364 family protein [Fervidobacterium]|uniref:CopG domain protein DNA-binding domain protein n=1 Tax=Fervidobacterium nodosum (strain ATCC 35602 / DSM 5306 / Rt17-B1) TaxID=381764 RepID=A7HNT2_FERNB|nr:MULTISPECIES: DUF6364 family protein [Fervidobacterium]ABS61565.1 CopG domain protein DNA-binding domain protein [Fervidobacterium nodosum Rt17-B1]KAF2961892.1 CopG family transcriptional regulator [Fervidobacterium sp. 2310opik-2]HOJ93880.1 DUF6364 family protein [Fervidobacterium nodosum]
MRKRESHKEEYQNITLSIPKNLILQVKHIAVERNTSISALVKGFLEELVKKESLYQKVQQRALKLLEKGFDLGTEGNTSWKREDLHERV